MKKNNTTTTTTTTNPTAIARCVTRTANAGIATVSETARHINVLDRLNVTMHNGLIEFDASNRQGVFDDISEDVRKLENFDPAEDMGDLLGDLVGGFPDDQEGAKWFAVLARQIFMELTGEVTSGNKSMITRKKTKGMTDKATQGKGGGRQAKAPLTAKEQAKVIADQLTPAVRRELIKLIVG